MPASAQPHSGEWALRRKRAGPARPLARPGTYEQEAVSGQPGSAVSDRSAAPGGVVNGEAEDKGADLATGGWSSPATGRWLGPVVGDALAVPPQHGLGGDGPTRVQPLGECGASVVGDDAEQGPVLIVEVGSVVLATRDGELVA